MLLDCLDYIFARLWRNWASLICLFRFCCMWYHPSPLGLQSSSLIFRMGHKGPKSPFSFDSAPSTSCKIDVQVEVDKYRLEIIFEGLKKAQNKVVYMKYIGLNWQNRCWKSEMGSVHSTYIPIYMKMSQNTYRVHPYTFFVYTDFKCGKKGI